jgi:hypothetical protein
MELLAADSRAVRQIGGVARLGEGGAVIVFWGATETEADGFLDYEHLQTIALAEGGFYALLGLGGICSPSRAEREFERIQRIPNLEDRERVAESSLVDLARRSRNTRMATGAVFAAAAATWFIWRPIKVHEYTIDWNGSKSDLHEATSFFNFLCAGLCAGDAILSFALESPAEGHLRQYRGQATGRGGISLHLGAEPRGGVVAVVSLSL